MSNLDIENDLQAARRVLRLEASALTELADSLGAAFGQALDIFSSVRGKTVVSGMGKSGHVSNKIAATLASTGTPAHFLHPAEASHGDLGMIGPDDALFLLANSGETAELRDLLSFAKIKRLPLVVMVGKAPSTMSDAADVALVLPTVGEACPLGLAPTTSSTMMLALGDAIAIALMERRGFSAEQYRSLHPGGKLGQRLLRVGDIMHRPPELPLISHDAVMSDAILTMTHKSFGCVGVIGADGSLVGIVTDGDLRRTMAADLLQRRVAEVMTSGPKTIGPEALAAEALGFMEGRLITVLFVIEHDKPVGLLHIHDILNAGVA